MVLDIANQYIKGHNFEKTIGTHILPTVQLQNLITTLCKTCSRQRDITYRHPRQFISHEFL